MGQDKAFLELDGRTLLDRALELARSVAGDVSIVGPKDKFARFGPVVQDILSGRGPLAGIHAALSSSKSDLNLILALDTPFVQAGFLRYLTGEAEGGAAVVTVPRIAGQSQPLCAIYRREFLAVAEDSLRHGRNKIDPLFSQVPCRVIDENELLRLGLDPQMFENLNTPEQWEQARHRSSAKP
jgi:molybdopterin-guanine dinucleotide biosynthesis protein A